MQQRTKIRFHRVEDVAACLFPGQKIETPSIWSVASSKLTDVNQRYGIQQEEQLVKATGEGIFCWPVPTLAPTFAQAGFLTSATPLLTLKKKH